MIWKILAKMKKKQILFVLLFMFMDSYSQIVECEKFKIGTFYTKLASGKGYSVRDEKTQTSYYKENDMVIAWEIRWLSDCSYELIFVNALNGDGIFEKGDKIITEITAINGDCYTFNRYYII